MKRLFGGLVLIASGMLTHGAQAACGSGGGGAIDNDFGTVLSLAVNSFTGTCIDSYNMVSGDLDEDLNKSASVSGSHSFYGTTGSSAASAEIDIPSFSYLIDSNTTSSGALVTTVAGMGVLGDKAYFTSSAPFSGSFEVCANFTTSVTGGTYQSVAGADVVYMMLGDGATFSFSTVSAGTGFTPPSSPSPVYLATFEPAGNGLQCTTGSFSVTDITATPFIEASITAPAMTMYKNNGTSGSVDQGVISGYLKITGLSSGVQCSTESGTPSVCGDLFGDDPLAGVKPEKCPAGCDTSVGNPINFSLGFKHQNESDYASGVLSFNRMYRSDATWYTNSVGQRWRHNFDRSVIVSGSNATVTTEDGLVYTYVSSGGVWAPNDPDMAATLQTVSGGYKYTLPNDTVETYNSSGQLIRVAYRGGASLNLTYTSGKLASVTDEQGRSLTFTYSGNRIVTMVTPAGTYSYAYSGAGNLTQVTKPDSKTRQYHYENTSFVNALTGITNEKAVRYATYGYDSQGRATSSEHAGGVDSYSIEYKSDGTVTTTNPLGKETTYTFQTIQGVRKIVGVEGHASTNCAAANKSYDYDTNGFLTSKTDWNSNVTTYTRNSKGLVTSMTEGYGSSAARTTTTSYISGTSLPDVVTVGTLSTDYGYDSFGRMTSKAVTDTATSVTRTTTYSYYSNTTDSNGNTVLGKLQTVNGSRTDVTDTTTYTYLTNGDLWKTTNALGHVTEIYARDTATGLPLEIFDANGTKTKLEYDSLGRLTKVTEGYNKAPLKGSTLYSYYDDGALYTVTLDNGVYIKHFYDDAGRENKINNSDSGEYYTLDEAGNRIETKRRKTAGSTITHRLFQTYDELSRLLSTRNNTNETTFQYDANDNLVAEVGTYPQYYTTEYEYDSRDRLFEITDRLGGTTSYDLTALDQTEGVTDARNVETSYTHNAFGDVLTETSPDRGTVTYTVDLAGNRTSMTDARGKVTNYTYDALNRLTAVSYPTNSANNVTLQYDLSTGCGAYKGKLCRVTDASGTTNYAYSVLGDLTSVTETRGSLTFTTSYTYDNAHYLTGITLPSGRSIAYTYNLNGEITNVSTTKSSATTTLASAFAYQPFGPVSGLTYGNGLVETNTHDDAYRLLTRTVGSVLSDTYEYDDRNNVKVKNGVANTYDAIDRLVKDGGFNIVLDGVGNRTNINRPSQSIDTDYIYSSGTSRLYQIDTGSGVTTLTYDSAGNQTGDGSKTYAWDDAGRLSSITGSGGTLGTYTYDAQNHRAKKVAGSTTTHYVYGAGGALYGEYSSTGALVREYVYLHGRPLAQVDSGSPESITYIHTDHLGTPRVGSNASGVNVWSWSAAHNAFGGITAPTGTKTINLRYAGQYFDTESGLFYNWNRYYNPTTGRYISSDPIGLGGGLNTFAYAGANPVMYVDPRGLIEWRGNLAAVAFAPGFGATTFSYDLVSDCGINGEIVRVKGLAVMATAAIGFDIGLSSGDIAFFDNNSDPDPYVFNGGVNVVSGGAGMRNEEGGITTPPSISFSMIFLGKAWSMSSGIVQGIQAEFGAGASMGFSMVHSFEKISCECLK